MDYHWMLAWLVQFCATPAALFIRRRRQHVCISNTKGSRGRLGVHANSIILKNEQVGEFLKEWMHMLLDVCHVFLDIILQQHTDNCCTRCVNRDKRSRSSFLIPYKRNLSFTSLLLFNWQFVTIEWATFEIASSIYCRVWHRQRLLTLIHGSASGFPACSALLNTTHAAP